MVVALPTISVVLMTTFNVVETVALRTVFIVTKLLDIVIGVAVGVHIVTAV
jgi:hypothetical protein